VWLAENGSRELESLFYAITLHPSASLLSKGADLWMQDYAPYLLNRDGQVTAWYPGAEYFYGYTSDEMLGSKLSLHSISGDGSAPDLERTAKAGYHATEGWQSRKDGSRVWAKVLTMALKDEGSVLRGFAGIARDFTGASEERRGQSVPVAVVFGELERISESNDVFLNLAGYSRSDLADGRMNWADMTPPEYQALDARAHEESLQFGVSAPYEKELVKKNGTRVAVQLTKAVLNLSPFRSITFVRDMTEPDQSENVEDTTPESEQDFKEMVGKSAALKRILRQVELVAPTDATVLILGETGTGKELVARAIHRLSPRRGMPCITLNCAAIPTGLLESELFGYERGAFTGALSQKIGRFEMAHRGTLFLDEVGDIPLDLQPKLLRALQEKSFERLGGTRTIPIDIRLVAATNRNLGQMMGDKLFRSDLYYRLKVFPITVPPLRDRPDDIPILARHFTRKYADKMNRQIDKIPIDTMTALTSWRWPGNIRELENFIERAVILSRGPNLRAPLSEIRDDAMPSAETTTLEQVEREHILRVFRESAGVVTTAATRLGLHRTTLNAMMRKLGISRSDL
jgi:PAS domain S-box-containing protein